MVIIDLFGGPKSHILHFSKVVFGLIADYFCIILGLKRSTIWFYFQLERLKNVHENRDFVTNLLAFAVLGVIFSIKGSKKSFCALFKVV